MADNLSLGPDYGERIRPAAGLRPLASVAFEPCLNALGPELGDAALDRIPTEAATLLRLVV